MRVLLVEPPISAFDVVTGTVGLPEPLALEYVAAPMMCDHDVTILDMRLEPNGLEEAMARVRPHVVASGGVTANLHLCKAVLRRARELDADVLTMIGGHHVTFRPQDAVEPYIDVVVMGEGEHSAKQVVDAFERGRSYADIPGLAVNEGRRQVLTRPPELVDLETLPLPARALVSRYRGSYFQRGACPIVSINSSRGCKNRCTFCQLWRRSQGTYRTRSAASVVDEIAALEWDFIDFIDDNTLDDIERSHRIADALIERGIRKRMKMYGRASLVAEHPDLIAKMAEAGLEMLLVGLEAVTQERLEDWNKASSLDGNRAAIEVLKRHGVRIISFFVVDPTFDVEDFQALWSYVDEHELYDSSFAVLVPMPGTDLYEEVVDEIAYDDYRLFDLFHTVLRPRLPLREFYEQFLLLYTQLFERQGLLRESESGPELTEAGRQGAFAAVYERMHSLVDHHTR